MADRWLISSTGQESTVLRPGFLCPPDPKPPISLYLWLSTPACVEHLFARELCSHENGTRSATRGTDDIATLRPGLQTAVSVRLHCSEICANETLKSCGCRPGPTQS